MAVALNDRLWVAVVVAAVAAVAAQQRPPLDLNATCSDGQRWPTYCTLANLSGTFEEPLLLADASAPQLRTLVVRDSVLTRFPREVFERAPNLSDLVVQRCSVNRIDGDDFAAAHQLQRLALPNNRLAELPERALAAATQLRELHLANNHIHLVHGRAFAALSRLQYLDLHANSVRQLPAHVFDDAASLEHVDLSANDIERITGDTFARNQQLRTLLLANNKFAAFANDSLLHLGRLHLLDLSYCALDGLALQSVDTLLVSGSELRWCRIQGAAAKVHANNNQLASISIGDRLSVRELELHGNLLASLDDFVGMANLQKLDVSRNRIRTLRTERAPLYLPLPSLSVLNLAANQLQDLSVDNFQLMPRLAHLDLAYNHLLQLDHAVFGPLLALERLYIEGNRLHRLDYEALLQSHAHLQEIGVFGNDWELPYARTMVTFLRDRGVQAPVRFGTSDDPTGDYHGTTTTTEHHGGGGRAAHHRSYAATTRATWPAATAGAASSHRIDLRSASGIHPYWTTHDILTVLTLLAVMGLILLQFYRILKEENFFGACRHRLGALFGRAGLYRPRPTRLVEEVSQV